MIDRRQYLKLMLASPAGFLAVGSVTAEELDQSRRIIDQHADRAYRNGFTPEELERDRKLNDQTFFTEHEMRTLAILSDFIIPADEHSGSATDAGVPDFIEFIVKDQPHLQLPARGGLMWLDQQCRERFDNPFADCTTDQQKEMLDRIAFPEQAEPDMAFGVRFFNRMRDLVATGFYTSEIGFRDLGYQGNTSTVWDGVPDHVLEAHNLAYDPDTIDQYARPDERDQLAEWDDDKNLLR